MFLLCLLCVCMEQLLTGRESSVCNVTATVMWAGMQLALQTSFVLAVQMLPVFTSVSLCCLVSQIVIYVDGFHTTCYTVPSARQHSPLLYLLVSALFQINKIIANVRGELSLPNLRIE